MRQLQDKFSIFKEFQAASRSRRQVIIDTCFRVMSWLGTWIFTICLGKGRVQCRRITRAHLCRAPHVSCVSMTFCWLFTHADTLPVSIFLHWASHTLTFQRSMITGLADLLLSFAQKIKSMCLKYGNTQIRWKAFSCSKFPSSLFQREKQIYDL